MTSVYIGIGSNLSDRQGNCIEAVERIRKLPGCRLTGCSGWYLTKPVGVEDQDWFVNGVASLTTGISPQDLLHLVLGIEAEMGRVRRERWGPRIIDIDILLFGQEIIQEESLKIPHPIMHLRRFVLEPFAELAPDVIHPVLRQTMKELLAVLTDEKQVVIQMKEK